MHRAFPMDIDPDIQYWVLEFLLRQSLDDQTLKALLRALPPPNDNPNLTKMFVLKKLESDTSRNSVSVATLELLEQLEETEFILGNVTVSDAMKKAYCAVAVDCTVKKLKGGDGEDGDRRFKFFEEVRRVWKGKIARMKDNVEKGGLGCEDLWAWKDEIEAAVWDEDASKSVVKKSEGVNGVDAVNAYIREEREKMGPSFLELVAEVVKSDEILQGIMGVDGKEATPSCVNVVAGGSSASKETRKVKKLREKHLALRRTRGLASGNSRGAKIVDPNETTNEPSQKRYKLPNSAEVHKTREALAKSSLELQAVVTDPLPDALKLAQAISREARNNNPQDHPVEDNHANSREARNSNPQDHPVEDNHANSREARNSNPQDHPVEDNHANVAGVAQAPGGNASNTPKPSLMERNNTAHTCEWESIDGSQEDPTCRGVARLPSPVRINISPLNHYQIANLKKRRKARKWSLEEEDTLRTEVDKYGKGQWKLILSLNRSTFEGRTEVDLKDKWRNMTRR